MYLFRPPQPPAVLLLPTFHARLLPCSESWTALTPTAQGRHCARCQRGVLDFTKSQNPAADLAAARAAAPDGRVCGRFGAAQMRAAPPLSRRLRWFAVALVLVVAQGLTAREALAQVRRVTGSIKALPVKSKPARQEPTKHADQIYGMVVEQMPSFGGGGNREVIQYIQQRIVWPHQNGKMIQTEGRVFVAFTVGPDGRVRNPKIMKSLQPLFDAEVLRVVRMMPNFKPGRQNGEPVATGITVPITFRLE